MKRWRVDMLAGHQLVRRESYGSRDEAERFYRETDPPHMLVLQLWEWTPPTSVVFGHTFKGYWTMIKEKHGLEEFA